MREGAKVADAREAGEIRDEELAAPEISRGAASGAVEGDADHGAGVAILGEARGDVSVVMLHGDRAEAAALGPLGRGVSRVEIVRDGLGDDAEQMAQLRDELLEEGAAVDRGEVADVL